MRLVLVFLCLGSLISCQSLKEQYRGRSSEIEEYCDAVFFDAGYTSTRPSKALKARCLSQTEDREQLKTGGQPLKPWAAMLLVPLYILLEIGG